MIGKDRPPRCSGGNQPLGPGGRAGAGGRRQRGPPSPVRGKVSIRAATPSPPSATLSSGRGRHVHCPPFKHGFTQRGGWRRVVTFAERIQDPSGPSRCKDLQERTSVARPFLEVA